MAPAPSGDLELDDGWADAAVRAPPPGLTTLAEPRATATATEATTVNSETTTEALELDFKGSFLRTGDEAKVVNSRVELLDSEKVTLYGFDGKLWKASVSSGPLRGRKFTIPSRNLEGCGRTLPT